MLLSHRCEHFKVPLVRCQSGDLRRPSDGFGANRKAVVTTLRTVPIMGITREFPRPTGWRPLLLPFRNRAEGGLHFVTQYCGRGPKGSGSSYPAAGRYFGLFC